MRKNFLPVSGKLIGAALVASLLAGCSSSSLRFQDGFYTGADSLTTASVPKPQADVQNGQSVAAVPAGGYPAAGASGGQGTSQPFPGDADNRYALAPASGGQSSIQRSDLPVTGQQPAADSLTTGTTPQQPAVAAGGQRPRGWSSEGAPRVSLQPGETIYSVAQRYGVPAAEIMRANNITDASRVAPGQQLIIPGFSQGGQMQATNTSPQPAPQAQPQQAASGATPTDPRYTERSLNQHAAMLGNTQAAQPATTATGGTYTVKSGDTLSKISRETGVPVAQIRQANSLTGDAIRVGQTLALGGGQPAATVAAAKPAQPAPITPTDMQQTGAVQQPAASAASAPSSVAQAPAQANPAGYTPPAQEANSEIADQVGNDVAAIAPETTGIGKLRWPVRGQVVTAFGAQDGGVRNDGIDISVPEGSEVRAAENGVVIYSGSGLKEYGNTVLVRHDNGLVTVYGHAKELKVNRGDTVTRGQVIALSGMTGTAQQPKLHFEVRENATPVNPSTFLE
jgi:murein DD-endopeptidase MepM/ murein hydrolase activator NlpD